MITKLEKIFCAIDVNFFGPLCQLAQMFVHKKTLSINHHQHFVIVTYRRKREFDFSGHRHEFRYLSALKATIIVLECYLIKLEDGISLKKFLSKFNSIKLSRSANESRSNLFKKLPLKSNLRKFRPLSNSFKVSIIGLLSKANLSTSIMELLRKIKRLT
uniref:Uncharacterized protein n=1 Tax=Romanomermis culicivorax TaxID=13658 RepID=A0A915I3K0_ROMCU